MGGAYAAGDIAPVCGDDLSTHTTIAKAVVEGRRGLVPSGDVSFDLASTVVEFGPTNMNLTLQRVGMCKSDKSSPAAKHAQEGELDLCSIFRHLDVNAHLGPNWLENKPRFTALTTRVSALWRSPCRESRSPRWARWCARTPPPSGTTPRCSSATATTTWDTVRGGMGWAAVPAPFLCPALPGAARTPSSPHPTVADPVEYQVGGYESLLTFWGIDTAQRIRTACRDVMSAVARAASA